MICTLCPRRCGAERTEDAGGGFCRMPARPVLARAALHLWEEPCISGKNGAGAVFFSGCNLRCSFCQNAPVSHGGFGENVSVARLREIFSELKAAGAATLDLVSATQFAPWVAEALADGAGIPVVWNTGGYESLETLRLLDGRVDVYLPDFKYADADLARRYSGAADYPETAKAAVLEMFRQTGRYRINADGVLEKGVLIRHMMLPGALDNTKAVIDFVAEHFSPGDVLFSLMRQYTPQAGAEGLLARTVSGAEYRAALRYMENCGVEDGYTQDAASADAHFTPAFDLTGVKRKETL